MRSIRVDIRAKSSATVHLTIPSSPCTWVSIFKTFLEASKDKFGFLHLGIQQKRSSCDSSPRHARAFPCIAGPVAAASMITSLFLALRIRRQAFACHFQASISVPVLSSYPSLTCSSSTGKSLYVEACRMLEHQQLVNLAPIFANVFASASLTTRADCSSSSLASNAIILAPLADFCHRNSLSLEQNVSNTPRMERKTEIDLQSIQNRPMVHSGPPCKDCWSQ